jgi:hypothetical protein
MCLAGVAPSTRKSGKAKAVTFRWAAGKQLRDAVCDFAADSRHASPWAAQLYNDATARGKGHPHATRILARAWLYVIWHCWHGHTAYNPAQHRALQRLLRQDQQAAALHRATHAASQPLCALKHVLSYVGLANAMCIDPDGAGQQVTSGPRADYVLGGGGGVRAMTYWRVDDASRQLEGS